MNLHIAIGRLTKPVELRFTQSGKAKATGTIAVDRRFQKDKTDFIPVEVWGNPAEKYFAPYGHKGRLTRVTGELHIDKWKDEEGNWKERSYIAASEVKFLDKVEGQDASPIDPDGFQVDDDDSDIPF
ncbi:single-stranded DNA-binding protein [Marinisporobacter balticus]|uniref:Single-stranded DNA-binding protein n=1 Tax=Marinisporobacter balticus TaxID=2018667 RepID=A0A4R2KGG1_9FIRM|nr:single-stranded DNA-binding protein [Marinisporobacter balticus]TCO69519.1 single-strand DNA-binding protein [Marinisporobacter balticus]